MEPVVGVKIQRLLQAEGGDLSDLQLPIEATSNLEPSDSGVHFLEGVAGRSIADRRTLILESFRRSENSTALLLSTLDSSIFHGLNVPDCLRGLNHREQLEVQRQAYHLLSNEFPFRSGEPSLTQVLGDHFSHLIRAGRVSDATNFANFFVTAGSPRLGILFGNIRMNGLPEDAQRLIIEAQRSAFREAIEQDQFRDLVITIRTGEPGAPLVESRFNNFVRHLRQAVVSRNGETARAGLNALQMITTDSSVLDLVRNSLSADAASALREELVRVTLRNSDIPSRNLAIQALALCPSDAVSSRLVPQLGNPDTPLGTRLATLAYFRNVPDFGISISSELNPVLETISGLRRGDLRAEARQLLTLQACRHLSEARLSEIGGIPDMVENSTNSLLRAEGCLRLAFENAGPLDLALCDQTLGTNIRLIVSALGNIPDPHGSFSRAFDRGLSNALHFADSDNFRLFTLLQVIRRQEQMLNRPLFLSLEQLNTITHRVENLALDNTELSNLRDGLLQSLERIRTESLARELFDPFFR